MTFHRLPNNGGVLWGSTWLDSDARPDRQTRFFLPRSQSRPFCDIVISRFAFTTQLQEQSYCLLASWRVTRRSAYSISIFLLVLDQKFATFLFSIGVSKDETTQSCSCFFCASQRCRLRLLTFPQPRTQQRKSPAFEPQSWPPLRSKIATMAHPNLHSCDAPRPISAPVGFVWTALWRIPTLPGHAPAAARWKPMRPASYDGSPSPNKTLPPRTRSSARNARHPFGLRRRTIRCSCLAIVCIVSSAVLLPTCCCF